MANEERWTRAPRMAAAVVCMTAAFVGGCATITADQCRSADWQNIGLRDGARGASVHRLESHRQACSKFGLMPDERAWLAGYERGLTESYCTIRGGFEQGRAGYYGARASGVCPEPLRPAFEEGARIGYDIHTAESVLQSLDDRIREMEGQLSQPGTPKERREVLLLRLQNMQADRRSERDRLERMNYRAAQIVGR